MEITFFAATDSGRVREHNEDRFLVNRRLNLYMVCDGMGGHAAGEVASEKATLTVHEVLAENHEILARYASHPDPMLRKDVLTLLEFAVRDACSSIYAMAQANAKQRGMGTTCSLMLLCGRRGFIAHVGDSRAYLLRAGEVHQLTEDHTIHNELRKRGKLTEEEVADMPFKNAITRAVGIYETVEVDTLDFDVLPGDRYLLCSDGLHGYFEGNNLTSLLSNPKLEAIPRNCIEFANRKGGSDNITVVVVATSEESEDLRAQEIQRKLEVLSGLDIFQFLDYKELSRIMPIMQRLEYAHDHVVIEADVIDEAMYIVLDGSIEVLKQHQRVGRLAAGQTFGTFALIDVHPKHTRYVVERDATLLRLPRDSFYELMRQDTTLAVKLLWNMLQVLGRRSADYLPELELDPRSFSDGISGIWNIEHLKEQASLLEEQRYSPAPLGEAPPQPVVMAPVAPPREQVPHAESARPRHDETIRLSPEEFEDMIEDDYMALESGDFEIIDDDDDITHDPDPTREHSRRELKSLQDTFDEDDDIDQTRPGAPVPKRPRRKADTIPDSGPPMTAGQDKFARLRSMIERQRAGRKAQEASSSAGGEQTQPKAKLPSPTSKKPRASGPRNLRNLGKIRPNISKRTSRSRESDKTMISSSPFDDSESS